MVGFILLYITFVILAILILGTIFKVYLKLTTGRCSSHICLVGKTAIVTGANTGIGYDTALDFAKRGAKVILACRDERRADEARTKIIQATENRNVFVKLVDLASFDSVRAFAEDVDKNEDRLDILVNNAGVIGIGDQKGANGQQLVMQINHFSHFLLTNLLLGLLKKSAPSRVINVSSRSGSFARNFDLDKLDEYPSDHGTYAVSKLCNILFTKELARRMEGTGVTAYSLCPGLVKTEVLRYMGGFMGTFNAVGQKLFGKTSEEGAQTTIYCSVAKGIEQYNGEHFSDCQRITPYRTTRTYSRLSTKLWTLSEEVVQLTDEDICP